MHSILVTLLLAFSAHAEAPPPGDFVKEKLYGWYRYEACENDGSSIWEGDHERQYVLISNDPFNTRAMPKEYLAAALFHVPSSPIVPIWEFVDLNQGWVRTYDEETRVVRNAHNNYTTASGVFSRMERNYGEDSGWATISISRPDQNVLTYEMARQDNLSGNSRRESCRLVKVPEGI